MHTENQLSRLPGSALKVPGGGGWGGWLPTHFKVSLQLELRLSWAVTKMEDDQKEWKTNQLTKINLIGCDTIVNSPSLFLSVQTKNQYIETIAMCTTPRIFKWKSFNLSHIPNYKIIIWKDFFCPFSPHLILFR